jgi:hypothetical protein
MKINKALFNIFNRYATAYFNNILIFNEIFKKY